MILLDTHIVIWEALEPRRLSVAEATMIRLHADALFLSAVSVWELRLKWGSFHKSGARKGPIAPTDVVEFGRRAGWRLLPLTVEHATTELRAPPPHRDPFDNLLLCQAQVEGLSLLTRDSKLFDHPLVVPV